MNSDSYNRATSPTSPKFGAQGRDLLGNTTQGGDPHNIQKPVIAQLPDEKSNFTGDNLEKVCMFQTAQIQRLNSSLQECKSRFKEAEKKFDIKSYETQIKELSQLVENSEINKNQNQKLKGFIQKQTAELEVWKKRFQNEDADLRYKYENSLKQIEVLSQENTATRNQKNNLTIQLNSLKAKLKALERLNIQRIEDHSKEKIQPKREIHKIQHNPQAQNGQLGQLSPNSESFFASAPKTIPPINTKPFSPEVYRERVRALFQMLEAGKIEEYTFYTGLGRLKLGPSKSENSLIEGPVPQTFSASREEDYSPQPPQKDQSLRSAQNTVLESKNLLGSSFSVHSKIGEINKQLSEVFPIQNDESLTVQDVQNYLTKLQYLKIIGQISEQNYATVANRYKALEKLIQGKKQSLTEPAVEAPSPVSNFNHLTGQQLISEAYNSVISSKVGAVIRRVGAAQADQNKIDIYFPVIVPVDQRQPMDIVSIQNFLSRTQYMRLSNQITEQQYVKQRKRLNQMLIQILEKGDQDYSQPTSTQASTALSPEITMLSPSEYQQKVEQIQCMNNTGQIDQQIYLDWIQKYNIHPSKSVKLAVQGSSPSALQDQQDFKLPPEIPDESSQCSNIKDLQEKLAEVQSLRLAGQMSEQSYIILTSKYNSAIYEMKNKSNKCPGKKDEGPVSNSLAQTPQNQIKASTNQNFNQFSFQAREKNHFLTQKSREINKTMTQFQPQSPQNRLIQPKMNYPPRQFPLNGNSQAALQDDYHQQNSPYSQSFENPQRNPVQQVSSPIIETIISPRSNPTKKSQENQ